MVVTGGWAATNMLRELLWSGTVLVDDDTCLWCCGRYSLGHKEDCEAAAALALVEAALEYVDHAEAVISRDPFGEAERKQVAELLIAALRAVREGK